MSDGACASQLGHAPDGNDAGKVCLLQDLRVGDFVLPVDVEKVSEAAEMSSICGPGFRAIE